MGLLNMDKNAKTTKKNKQPRVNITFKSNQEEQELYEWILEGSKVGGTSAFIKNKLYKVMLEENNAESEECLRILKLK